MDGHGGNPPSYVAVDVLVWAQKSPESTIWSRAGCNRTAMSAGHVYLTRNGRKFSLDYPFSLNPGQFEGFWPRFRPEYPIFSTFWQPEARIAARLAGSLDARDYPEKQAARCCTT